MLRGNDVTRLSVVKTSIAIALAMAVGACQDGATDSAEKNGVVDGNAGGNIFTDAIRNSSDLSTSAKLIDLAQLGTAVDGEGSYTVFLPVDDAWAALNEAQRNAIESEENKPQLIAVLRQHIAPGYVLAADLEHGLSENDKSVSLTTMGAVPLTLRRDGNAIVLGEGADAPRIVGKPIVAGNDVIYRIDRLIPPPS